MRGPQVAVRRAPHEDADVLQRRADVAAVLQQQLVRGRGRLVHRDDRRRRDHGTARGEDRGQ
jgi:hypothetical protein